MSLDEKTRKKLDKNAEEIAGGSWQDVCADFDAEMLDLKREAGLKPWQHWGDKKGAREVEGG